jgi:hypothetical protein
MIPKANFTDGSVAALIQINVDVANWVIIGVVNYVMV